MEVSYDGSMLTDTDIQKLMSVLATKQDVLDVKEEVGSLREPLQNLATSIDALAKCVDDLRTEYAAMTSQLERHEQWIKQLAEKANISLKY